MINVKRTFFLTREEANKVGPYVVHGMPHYELEDGYMLYTCGAAADYAIEHWTSSQGEIGDRGIKVGLDAAMTHIPSQTVDDELRDEITGIIYGDDWESGSIAKAHKPDVEAAMHLITLHTQKRDILNELHNRLAKSGLDDEAYQVVSRIIIELKGEK